LRYPDWFRFGVSKVFSATVITGDEVAVGGNAYAPREIDVLLSKPLIPMREFLRLRAGDPQLQVKDAGYRYDAQCWLLAHLIMIDKLFAKEFTSYLHLVSEGQGEDAAFAASFTISYEDLDRAIVAAWNAGKLHTLVMTIPDERVKALPVHLSAAEAKGRLAGIAAANDRTRDYGLKLVSEALAADPTEEHALRALALAQTRRQQYSDALATLDKLAASNSVSGAGYAESGDLVIAVVRAIRSKKAALPTDPTVLAHRAYDDYRRAIALEAESLEYWASFADAIGEEHDATEAKEFLPKVEQLFYQHPRNSALASHIAYLCSNTGNYDDAIKFAVAWKANAITIQSRDAAVAFLSRTQADRERQRLLPAPGVVAQGAAP
jgi:tetratricopeptide (TPR) repeat protein